PGALTFFHEQSVARNFDRPLLGDGRVSALPPMVQFLGAKLFPSPSPEFIARFSPSLIVSRHCQRPRSSGYSRRHQPDSIQSRIAPCPSQHLCLNPSFATLQTGAAFLSPPHRMPFPSCFERSSPLPLRV